MANVVNDILTDLGLPKIPMPAEIARELGIPTPAQLFGGIESSTRGFLGRFRR